MVHVAPAAPPSVNMVPVDNDDMCRPFPTPSEDLGLMTEWMIFKSSLTKCRER